MFLNKFGNTLHTHSMCLSDQKCILKNVNVFVRMLKWTKADENAYCIFQPKCKQTPQAMLTRRVSGRWIIDSVVSSYRP